MACTSLWSCPLVTYLLEKTRTGEVGTGPWQLEADLVFSCCVALESFLLYTVNILACRRRSFTDGKYRTLKNDTRMTPGVCRNFRNFEWASPRSDSSGKSPHDLTFLQEFHCELLEVGPVPYSAESPKRQKLEAAVTEAESALQCSPQPQHSQLEIAVSISG